MQPSEPSILLIWAPIAIVLACGFSFIVYLWKRTHSDLTSFQTRLFQDFSAQRSEIQQTLVSTHGSVNQRIGTLETQLLKEQFQSFEKLQALLHQTDLKLKEIDRLGASIQDLGKLLRLPHLRGGFGENLLERILTDMLPSRLFALQYAIDPDSKERVDAIVRLPNQVLPIDSKFPREQVLPLFDSADPQQIKLGRKMLADQLKILARDIAKKYIRPELGTTPLALIFLPSETLYFEALHQTELFEELAKYRVYPTSPNTLAVTLHSIELANQYYEMAKGVEKTLQELQKSRSLLHKFTQKFEEVGKLQKRSLDMFDESVNALKRFEGSVTKLTQEEANPDQPLDLEPSPRPTIEAP